MKNICEFYRYFASISLAITYELLISQNENSRPNERLLRKKTIQSFKNIWIKKLIEIA